MTNKRLIDRLYKILPIYEEGNQEAFERYLKRTIIEFDGLYEDNEHMDLIVASLRGMKKNYFELDKPLVKCTVFNMISVVKDYIEG